MEAQLRAKKLKIKNEKEKLEEDIVIREKREEEILRIEKDIKGVFPNIWICSDPHYNHKNICRGTTNWRTTDNEIPVEQTRDFPTIERMNESILNGINWNVGQDDVLICLGDWSFGGFEFIRRALFLRSHVAFWDGWQALVFRLLGSLQGHQRQALYPYRRSASCLYFC